MKTVYIIEDEYYRYLKSHIHLAIILMEERLKELMKDLGLEIKIKKEEKRVSIHYTDAVIVFKRLRSWIPCKLPWSVLERLDFSRKPCKRKYNPNLIGQLYVRKRGPIEQKIGRTDGYSATESWIYVEAENGCVSRIRSLPPKDIWVEDISNIKQTSPFIFKPTISETENRIKEEKRRLKKQVILSFVLSNVAAYYARSQYILGPAYLDQYEYLHDPELDPDEYEVSDVLLRTLTSKNCDWVAAAGLDKNFDVWSCESTKKGYLGYPPHKATYLEKHNLKFDRLDRKRILIGIETLEKWDEIMKENNGIYKYLR